MVSINGYLAGSDVDGNKLFGYIKVQAFFEGLKIKAYYKKIGISYESLFAIKRNNRISRKLKTILDDLYMQDEKYQSLYK